MQILRMSRLAALFASLSIMSISMSPTTFAQQAPNDAIIGKWEADDGSMKLDMFKSGSEFGAHLLYGKLVMEADNVTFKNDENNPDPALRSRSLKNIVFLTGLRWDHAGWSGGSLYDASSGRTYSCEVTVEGGKMNLRGYIGISALGQTRGFHRI